ncbi:retention module-containing protein [Campylobacter concisus]
MAKEAGVVKSLTGKAVAVDQNGNERELKVGDIVYMGESVKTSDAADKVTIVANNGKELTVLGSDTLSLNPNTIGAEGLADISALQNAILNGGDLTKLEETAAGGNAAAGGGGDGVSLGAASFAEGGHYSNINETYRNLTDTNRAFESYDSSIGGYSNDSDDTIIPGAPLVTFVNDTNNDGTLSRVEHGNDTDINTSKVLITVPNDGTVRVGDVLNITVTDPNGNEVKTNVVITPSILTGGYPLNAPIETGKISKVDATITNFQGNVSGKSEDSVTPTGFSAPVVKFTEDMNPNNNPDQDPDNDGLLTYTENNKDGNLNETPVLITVTDVIVGDILHVKLTKPDGTVENKNVPITQNIIDNGYKINDMPVAEDKLSKVEAYVTDSTNTMTSATASDETTPDVKPTLVFTEDGDNNGSLTDAENKGTDGNFRTSPVEITLPKDVVAGDKIVITYTDPLNPTGPKLKSDPINLTDEMITNHKVTGIEIPIFPGVKTEASVHVVDKDGNQKSEESAPDSVTPQTIKMDMNLPEQKTLHEISRQESVTKINSDFDTRTVDLGDEKVNHTTAKITLPNRVDDGDKLTLSIKTPKLDPNDPEGKAFLKDSNGKTEFENTKRDFTIHVNDKGVITKVVEHTNSGDVEYAPLKEELNQWAINVEGFSVRHGEDTTITASITHINPNRNAHIAPVEASASLEYVKAPEVIFEEANGAKTMTREQAISVDGLNSTKVTIKLPKNAVSGDKLTVTINEPDGKNPDGTTKFHEYPKYYTVGRDANGKFFVKDSADNEINTETDGRSFKISGIKTATGEETKVTAEIVDSDGSIQHAKGSSSVTIAGINDMAVKFVEDGDGNVSLTRSESKDGDNDLLKTTIAVKVPNNVIAGDVVIVKIDNGTSPKIYEVTGRDPSGKIILEDKSTHTSITASDKNEIEIKDVQIEAGKTINVSAETTDASGGKKAEAKNHNTLEKLHNDMKITFEEDADNDGILYNSEANSDHSVTTTTATIKLPSNFVVGDKLVVESYNEDAPNNKTTKEYAISKGAGGNLVAIGGGETLNIVEYPNGNKVVKYTLNLTEDHTTIINAKVTDNTGVDKVGTKSDIMLDAQGAGAGTGFRLFINEDSDRNEILSRDEAMSDGQLNTTSATLQIPTTVNSGDVIKVKVNGGVEQEYTVVSNVGNRITLKFPDNHTDLLPADNKLTIPDVHIDKNDPAQVEATINGVTKTAKATLETIDTKDLKVEFIEDDASRDKTIDRDEAISVDGVKVTTISVQVPYNVITGDKVEVLITEPKTDGTTATRPVNYTVSKAPDGKISLIDDTDLTHTPHELKNNTIRIGGVAMLPGRETSVTAIISNGSSEPVPSPEAKIKLAPLSEAGLNLNIGADLNDNGTITRDESDKGLIQSGGSTSKVNVSIPGSVIEGDKIDVEITNPGATTPFTKSYKVISKDVNGNIVLEDLVTHSQFSLDRDQPLQFDAKIEVGAETKAKVTLTDAFDNHVSKTDSASAEIDAIRGALLRDSGSQDKAQIKVYLNEDAKAGDKVEFKYTDPDDHTQTKTDTYELTDQDIGKGVFEYSLDINARSAYDLNVETTLITPNGLASKVYSNDLHLNVKNYTINYDENSTMKGGEGSADTLVVDNKVVDFSRVTGLDAKVESFENIQLKGNSEIKFDANAIFDITDNPNTVLKIKGDATNKVDIKGKWELEKDPSIHADAGFKGYSSKDQVDGHTIHIQIDDKVQTDL